MTKGFRHFIGGAALGFFISSLVIDACYHVPSGACEFASLHTLTVLIYSMIGGIAAWGLLG